MKSGNLFIIAAVISGIAAIVNYKNIPVCISMIVLCAFNIWQYKDSKE